MHFTKNVEIRSARTNRSKVHGARALAQTIRSSQVDRTHLPDIGLPAPRPTGPASCREDAKVALRLGVIDGSCAYLCKPCAISAGRERLAHLKGLGDSGLAVRRCILAS